MSKGRQLLTRLIVRGFSGFLAMTLLLFIPAGRPDYLGAWLLLITMFILMFSMSMVLFFRYPETLERRLKAKESQNAQKWYVSAMGALFLASFILAGLDFRFGWSAVPFGGQIAALIVIVFGYGIYSCVMIQNAYASRVIEVQKGQKLISTGLYRVVRHPLYLSSMLVFLPMPIVLGSYIALIPMLVFPATLVLRIKNEESMLIRELEGYAGYMMETRYRLVPHIW